MVNPTGYTALDLIGFTDKGPYLSSENYVKNDLVHYSGNIWRCLIDDTTGIAPAEGVNWTLFIGEPTNLVERIIAPVETDPATNAWAVGRQIIFNDNLYEVIAAITAGDALVTYEDDPTNANIKLADPVETQVLAQKTQIQTLTNQANAMVNVYGSKNLAPNEATNGSTSGGSVTITVNDDESITLNGTATSAGVVVIYGIDKPFWNDALKGKNVTLTGFPQGTFPSGTVLRINFQKIVDGSQTIISSIIDSGSGASGVIPNDTTHVSYYISVASTTVFNNVTFKPMLRDARIADSTYEPYAKTNRQLTEALTTQTISNSNVVAQIGTLNSSPTHIKKIGNVIYFKINVSGLSVTANTWTDIVHITGETLDEGQLCMCQASDEVFGICSVESASDGIAFKVKFPSAVTSSWILFFGSVVVK